MNKWIRGTNSAVLSAAVIGLFILSTLFLGSQTKLQWDLTANKRNTLSEKTVTTLQNLKTKVRVTAFYTQSNPVPREVSDLLREYSKRSDNFTFEEVDGEKEPTLARKYEVTSAGTLVVEANGKNKKLYDYEMFGGGQNGTYQFSGEEKLTQAIVQLTSDKQYPVYFLSGHGEIPIGQLSSLQSALEGDNYVVKELNLVREGKIPDDAVAVFLMGPANDLTDQELGVLKEYVNGKGKLYVALGYSENMSGWKNLPSLLSDLGVKSQNAVAVEAKRTLFTDPLAIVPEYGFHDTVNELDNKRLVTVLPGAIALAADKENQNFRATAILRTSADAYGKSVDVFKDGKITAEELRKTDQDLKGPLELAYAVEDKDGKPKAIVIGNAAFVHNDLFNQQANKNFALNTAGWLQENKDLVTIGPREESYQQAFIMPSQANWIFWGTVALFPAFFLVTGGLVWWRRRTG